MQGSIRIKKRNNQYELEIINKSLLIQKLIEEFKIKDNEHIFYFSIKEKRHKNKYLALIHADILPRLLYVLKDAGWEIYTEENAKDWVKTQMGFYHKIEIDGKTFAKLISLADLSEAQLQDFINYGNQIISELS